MRYKGIDMFAKRCEDLFLICARSVREMKSPCSCASGALGWMVSRVLGRDEEGRRMQLCVEMEAELGKGEGEEG